MFELVVVHRLHLYHDNTTGFVLFGHYFARWVVPPHGAVIQSKYGYDGQFFYLLAKDPLLLHNATVNAMRLAGQAFRMQRIAYPGLAFLLALGQRRYLPEALLGLNLLAVALLTVSVAIAARRHGRSGWWALPVGLMSGLLTATLRDLSDPLAVAAMIAGLLMWQRRQRWRAAGLLSLAVLAREPMTLAVVAIALDALVRAFRERKRAGAMGAILIEAAPVVVLPALVFIGWQLYIDLRFGGNAAANSVAFLPPFVGVVKEIKRTFHDHSARDIVWELTFIGLMGAGILAAARLVWQRVTAAGVAALLLGLSLLVLLFGDPWSYTRLSAPMFATLALSGVERRSWIALGVCTAGAALTLLMPLAPWFGAS